MGMSHNFVLRHPRRILRERTLQLTSLMFCPFYGRSMISDWAATTLRNIVRG